MEIHKPLYWKSMKELVESNHVIGNTRMHLMHQKVKISRRKNIWIYLNLMVWYFNDNNICVNSINIVWNVWLQLCWMYLEENCVFSIKQNWCNMDNEHKKPTFVLKTVSDDISFKTYQTKQHTHIQNIDEVSWIN